MRFTTRAAAMAGLLALTTACTTARPSPRPVPRPVPMADSAGAPLALATPEAGGEAPLTLPLNGEYIVTIKAPLVGEIQGRLIAQPTEEGFYAATRPGVAWDMIGGLEGLFGSIFVGSLFPNGSILTWDSTLPAGGTPGMGTLGPGTKSAQARTRITSPTAPIELNDPDGRHIATMTLRPAKPSEPAPADYAALAAGVEDAIRARLYDASLINSGQVRGYLKKLRANAGESRDDIEMIFGAIVAGRSNVKFALPLVFKAVQGDWKAQLTSLADAGMSTIKVTFDEPSGIATVKVEAFIDAAGVDRAFEQVLSFHPRGVVLDIRGCPGITLASLRAASWVIDKPADAGTFFGSGMRAAALAGHAGEFPRMSLDSAESVETIEKYLDEHGGARIVVQPAEHHYTGPVAVLTTKKTTTSAEPLAWMLRATDEDERIQTFGQATAGRPTLSRPIDIGQDWVVWLAAFDYQPPASMGKARGDRGSRPDYESSSKDKAKQAAYDWVRKQAGPQ